MISDLEKIYGDKLEIIEQLRPIYDSLEKAGYEFRGSEERKQGTEIFTLTVWTMDDWLVRVKHFQERGMAEIAAFDSDGFLCPLEKAYEIG